MLRVPPWAVAAAAIIVGALCTFLWREHAEVVVLRAKVTRGDAERVPTTAMRRESSVARTASLPDGGASSTTSATPISHAAAPSIPPETERQIRGRMLQYQRWTRLSKKAGIIAGLSLPPDKLARFKDLLVERDYAETDARDAASGAGIEKNSAEATDVAARAMAESDARIRELLGEVDFEKYSELTGVDLAWAGPTRDVIVGYFVDAGAPLTAEQTSSLARMFYQGMLTQARGYNGQLEEPDPATGLKPSQKTILDQAAQVLSSGQSATLREFFINDNHLGALMAAPQSHEAAH